MLFGREIHQVGVRAEDTLTLFKDSQTFVYPQLRWIIATDKRPKLYEFL